MNCGLQQLHEAGKTMIVLPGGSIPRWLDKESRGASISFWFRNQFPPKVLCFLIASVRDDTFFRFVTPDVLINGKVQEYEVGYDTDVIMAGLDHMQLFDLHVLPFRYKLRKMASEKEWKHVEITYEGLFDTSLIKSMGIHMVKSERRGMKDIRYHDPYTTTTQKRAREDYDTAATQVNNPITRRRPKRNNTKPKHLNDYDCSVKG